MISSTHAVAWAGSKMLGGHMSNCSSWMDVELSNWLAVGVVGKTKSSSSPRLITPCISGVPCFPAHYQLKQLHQKSDFSVSSKSCLLFKGKMFNSKVMLPKVSCMIPFRQFIIALAVARKGLPNMIGT